MEYDEGKIGRVFVLRFDDGEDFVDLIHSFVKEKEIRTGHINILGAFLASEIVTGPKEPVLPPEPNWTSFADAWEVLGFGTIMWEDDEPRIHIHAGLGKGEKTLLGCVRKKTDVFLTVEAVITEVIDIKAERKFNEQLGLSLLSFKQNEV
ncbi:MAG: DUF296 domain-containing protein [Deltaproteobacteria bacterium]|nr:DUF296 domain-containing protein [Deltaproteobacteria bacterium]